MQLDAAPVVAQQWREAPANAQVDAHFPVLRINAIHVIALFVGDHFERQLVVVAQKKRPLAGFRNRWRELQNFDDGEAVFRAHGHEQARHQRKVKGHVAFVALAEIGDGVLRPLIGLGQDHAAGILAVHMLAQFFQEDVRLGQVFAVGAFPLVEIRHGVQAETVHSHVEPEFHGLKDRLADFRAIVIEVRLMRVEAMPEVRFSHRVPGPVGGLGILEDDARFAILVRRIAPDVEIAPHRARRRAPGALEPGVLVGGVIEDQFGDDAQTAVMGLPQKIVEILQSSVSGMDASIVGNIVTVIAQGGGIKGQHPDGRHAQIAQVIELLGEAREVADAVVTAVAKGANMHFVDDGFFVPGGIGH